ncbi:hypothetical protein [Maribacter sp. ACAM166]|uniref:hypothetical protein n=1 Tax=Maribacter sp. ACAM166 TaxID=2508996 RepID=UPI0010FD79C2|nr:hypothetical protein [Maribacter sp. ACAM166]TLP70675.1 hypothetical protein ES765_20420 [Maribacter sp. ACAM166]
MDKQYHLNMNPDQVSDFAKSISQNPVVMLNMVKYKALVPETGIKGKESSSEYMRQSTPFIVKANTEIVYYGSLKHLLIGSEEYTLWDDVLIVKYNSVSDFMSMLMAKGYPSNLREQALVNSRLIHCTPNQK